MEYLRIIMNNKKDMNKITNKCMQEVENWLIIINETESPWQRLMQVELVASKEENCSTWT